LAQQKDNNLVQHMVALQRPNNAMHRYRQAIKTLATIREMLWLAPSPVELLAVL
jgi:hypothetical protein